MPHTPLHVIQDLQRRMQLETLRQQSLPAVSPGDQYVTPGMSGQEIRAWATPADQQVTAHHARQGRAAQAERALAGASMEGLKRVMAIEALESQYPGRAAGGFGPTGIVGRGSAGLKDYTGLLGERAEKSNLLQAISGREVQPAVGGEHFSAAELKAPPIATAQFQAPLHEQYGFEQDPYTLGYGTEQRHRILAGLAAATAQPGSAPPPEWSDPNYTFDPKTGKPVSKTPPPSSSSHKKVR